MDIDKQSCVVFFMKYPEPGQVKTRLGRTIGQQQAAELYTCFVEDVAVLLTASDIQTICCYEPDTAELSIQNWLGPRHVYVPQEGTTLGKRQETAFAHSFKLGFSRTIVIGTDSPDLPASYLQEAVEAIESHDSVIGPSTDGGYYLIGLQEASFVPEVFRDIAWSTPRVYDQILAALTRHNLKVHVLPAWHDVDTYADLCALVERNADTSFASSRTYRTIIQNGWHQRHGG